MPVKVSPLVGHELWADCYDSVPNPLLHLEARRLASILPRIENLIVADLGCGTGRWLCRLAAGRPAFVVGVDFSPAMLRIASSKKAGPVWLVLATLEQIPLRSGTFDLVICNFAQGYLSELGSFVGETHRVLKPGGSLFLTDLHPAVEGLDWRRAFKRGAETHEILSQFRSLDELAAVFRDRFELVRTCQWSLDEPERPIFEATGRLKFYEEARQIPAVVFFEWAKRSDSNECRVPSDHD